jgi:hypothetical protein
LYEHSRENGARTKQKRRHKRKQDKRKRKGNSGSLTHRLWQRIVLADLKGSYMVKCEKLSGE